MIRIWYWHPGTMWCHINTALILITTNTWRAYSNNHEGFDSQKKSYPQNLKNHSPHSSNNHGNLPHQYFNLKVNRKLTNQSHSKHHGVSKYQINCQGHDGPCRHHTWGWIKGILKNMLIFPNTGLHYLSLWQDRNGVILSTKATHTCWNMLQGAHPGPKWSKQHVVYIGHYHYCWISPTYTQQGANG